MIRPDQFETRYYPELPCLGSQQAKQIADITWALCLITRVKAHALPGAQAAQTSFDLFFNTHVSCHPINIILSFAPELFGYYIDLLDFGLYQEPTTSP